MTKRSLSRSKQHLLKSGIAFHGHLGPYLVLGLRMGMLAVRDLKPKQLHELSAVVWTQELPPQSCVLDGIQISSGCTLGKGNIGVRGSRRTKARFRRGNQTLVIGTTEKAETLLSGVSAGLHSLELEQLALSLYRMPDRELFTTSVGKERSR